MPAEIVRATESFHRHGDQLVESIRRFTAAADLVAAELRAFAERRQTLRLKDDGPTEPPSC